MFIWDLKALIAVWAILLLVIVLTTWVFYTFRKGCPLKDSIDSGYLMQCEYCGRVYLNFVESIVGQCPGCRSYHD